ncbi:MAG: secondary thiamine-phosphate synthase enzyme YjbQ [Bauldia sp.]|nr:secondary thiamine-phosphate synthase enzyme YjbQ [Bauldia sp.]
MAALEAIMSRIAIKDEEESSPPGRLATAVIAVATTGAGFVDLTPAIEAWLERQGMRDGLLTLFIRHTSASLTIQENADPDVRKDLLDALGRLAPESAPWRHASEGPDDMPSHVKAALTDTSLSLPVLGGELTLGTWQAIYLIEHRTEPQDREVRLHYLGS